MDRIVPLVDLIANRIIKAIQSSIEVSKMSIILTIDMSAAEIEQNLKETK